MNDNELDNWLLEHNARLVAQTHLSVDIEERLVRVPEAAAYRPPVITRTRRRTRKVGTWSQWSAALAVAVSATVACLTMPTRTPAPDPVPASPDYNSTVEAGAPVAFRTVSGPADMKTAVPALWESSPPPVPGMSHEVRDPEDPARFLRFGASEITTATLHAELADYEGAFAADKENYERIRLSPTTFDGADAVEWEFEYDQDTGRDGRRHAFALYWRLGGHDYFIYASAPASRWHDMQPILATMRGRTTVVIGAS